eukprot:2148953-Prymnesium_polylepis.2
MTVASRLVTARWDSSASLSWSALASASSEGAYSDAASGHIFCWSITMSSLPESPSRSGSHGVVWPVVASLVSLSHTNDTGCGCEKHSGDDVPATPAEPAPANRVSICGAHTK